MPTSSVSVTVANTTGQSMGYMQSDGFVSPTTLGQPIDPTTGRHSLGPALFPYGASYSGFGPIETVTTGITAHAGGGQGSATALTSAINIITTVATAADSVILPSTAVIGQTVVVRNQAATNAAAVFPPTGGAINGGTTNASVSLAAGAVAQYTLVAANAWSVTG